MTPQEVKQVAEVVSTLRFRSMRDKKGRALRNLSQSVLWGKINYLKSKLEMGADKIIGEYQEPFNRGEWLTFLEIELKRRKGHLSSDSIQPKLVKALQVLTEHDMLKEPDSSPKIVELRPAHTAPTDAPSLTPKPPSATPKQPAPIPTEDLEVYYYITKGDGDKKSYATYSSSALYFVGNHKQAQTFPKELAEEISAVLEKTVGIKSNEQFVLQKADNTYFIIFDGYPISLSGQKVERVGSIGQATPYKDKVSAMDAIAALEILFGFVISKFSILAEIPNSDKTVTVWTAQNPSLTTNHA